MNKNCEVAIYFYMTFDWICSYDVVVGDHWLNHFTWFGPIDSVQVDNFFCNSEDKRLKSQNSSYKCW